MLREAGYYAGFALSYGKLRFARLESNPEGVLRRYLENRGTHFLGLMRAAVFDQPANPYRTLFQWAGCEFGDLERSVHADGVEGTLECLRRSGVFLLHDEYKGKRPIQRGNQTLAAQPGDFANPLYTGVLRTASSGSRSRPTITHQSLDYIVHRELQEQVLARELRLKGKTDVRVVSILPSTEGFQRALFWTRRGNRIDRLFAQWGDFRTSGHYQWMTRLLTVEAKLLGVNLPFHRRLPHDDFTPVAEWLAYRKSQGAECVLTAGVSNAVRVAGAASEKGLDIRGTLMRVYGEALTGPKRAVLEAVGTLPNPHYAINELGKIGNACLEMTTGNGGHVWQDSIAVIGHRKPSPLSGTDVDSLLFTTLLPFAPSVLINVEMDDSGVLAPARCDCSLAKLGLTLTVNNIFSYGKLTGQGMTLVGADVLRILEVSLPARFGGLPTDYQLTEREGRHQTEIELRVHPQVGAASAEDVRGFFLAELRKVYGGALSSRNWSETNGVKVVFAEPYKSGTTNKVNSLHLLGSANGAGHRET